jgi:hypothetical protein
MQTNNADAGNNAGVVDEDETPPGVQDRIQQTEE